MPAGTVIGRPNTPTAGLNGQGSMKRSHEGIRQQRWQAKPTGTIGPDTQAAIQKFERERKLPVTGQVSDRLMRELAAVIGHPIE